MGKLGGRKKVCRTTEEVGQVQKERRTINKDLSSGDLDRKKGPQIKSEKNVERKGIEGIWEAGVWGGERKKVRTISIRYVA